MPKESISPKPWPTTLANRQPRGWPKAQTSVLMGFVHPCGSVFDTDQQGWTWRCTQGLDPGWVQMASRTVFRTRGQTGSKRGDTLISRKHNAHPFSNERRTQGQETHDKPNHRCRRGRTWDLT